MSLLHSVEVSGTSIVQLGSIGLSVVVQDAKHLGIQGVFGTVICIDSNLYRNLEHFQNLLSWLKCELVHKHDSISTQKLPFRCSWALCMCLEGGGPQFEAPLMQIAEGWSSITG